MPDLSYLVDPHNLGALETKAGHQTLLIESEGVDAAMDGVGSEAAGHSFVYDVNARTRADLPAARVVHPIHRLLIHQEEGVAVFLDAGLQAIGGGYGPVAAARLAVHEKDSLTSLRSKDEAGFDDIRKNKNGDCFRFTLAAAGFWATSCCRARRESLVKLSADAVPVLSNAIVASVKPVAYLHFDVIFIYVFVSLGRLVEFWGNA